jgi:DNA-binding NarL/FixJ family response regulator
VLHGTQSLLESKGHQVAATCSNGIEAYNKIMSLQPSIAVLDINMPGLNGIEIMEKLQPHKVRTKIILLTMQSESSIFNRAVALGAKGYLLKEFAMDEIEKCVRAVDAGDTYFSSQLTDKLTMSRQNGPISGMDQLSFAEKKILQLVAQQKSSREIATILFISEKTVESHRSHIIKKLNIPPAKNALLMWAISNFSGQDNT